MSAAVGLAAALLIPALAVPTSPGRAADSFLEIRTGPGASTSIETPIFDDVVLVPGDLLTETLHVKNVGPASGFVHVAALSPDADCSPNEVQSICDSMTLNGHPLRSLVGDGVTIATGRVADGDELRIDLAVSYPLTESTIHRLQTFTFDVRVTIVGDAPSGGELIPLPGGTPDPSNPGNPAPPTGWSVSTGGASLGLPGPEALVVAAASGAGIVGILFAALRRRRRSAKS